MANTLQRSNLPQLLNLAEAINWYAEGKAFQYRTPHTRSAFGPQEYGPWMDWPSGHMHPVDASHEYRLKPQPKVLYAWYKPGSLSCFHEVSTSPDGATMYVRDTFVRVKFIEAEDQSD